VTRIAARAVNQLGQVATIAGGAAAVRRGWAEAVARLEAGALAAALQRFTALAAADPADGLTQLYCRKLAALLARPHELPWDDASPARSPPSNDRPPGEYECPSHPAQCATIPVPFHPGRITQTW
jgi:hypothetical protein